MLNNRALTVVLLLIPAFAYAQLYRPSQAVTLSVTAGSSVQLAFNTNTSVDWSLEAPALGVLSPSGLYTAPPSVEGSPTDSVRPTDTVRAASAIDPTKQLVFLITIAPRVSITPPQATVFAGEILQFSANGPVGWAVVPNIGSIDAQGLYLAPAQLAATQTILVVATSESDPTNTAAAEVTVRPSPVVILPASATLTAGQSTRFQANTNVVWSMTSGPGTVDQTGLYTAPTAGLEALTATLAAVSQSDATNFATATVQLVTPLVVSPQSVELLPTKTQQFIASDGVIWTHSPPFGSISETGLYTAPPDGLNGQTVAIVATRAGPPFDTVSATVTLKNPESLTFSIWVSGPRSVAQGRMAIVAAGTHDVAGSTSRVRASISKLPPNSRGYLIVNITRYPNAANISLNESFGVKVITTPATPVGHYSLALNVSATAADGSQVERNAEIPVEVRQPAGPLAKMPFPPDVPLAALKQWEENMLTYGKKQVAQNHIGCCGSFTGPWYYDGARAFLQMADYTGDPSFLDFARRINEAYRDNMLVTEGSRKYAVFPHGLREFYLRYGDEQSREALRALHKNPGYTYRAHWGVPWNASREMAYGLSNHIVAESVGLPRRIETGLGFEPGESLLDEHLAIVLGHFEQWFVSETARFVYPFMVGLSAEALIDYYEVSGDPEVPWLLKLAADKMYPNPLTWHEGSESMMIVEEVDGAVTRGPAPDLNLMIAPLYGWLFQHTGDVKYRDIGDRIFASGVSRAYLDGGKQFTQNYRWSFKYVEWRKSPLSGGEGGE